MIEKSSDKSSERTSDVAVSDIDKEEDKEKDNNIYVPYKEIITYLNEKTGKKLRWDVKSNQKEIKARFNEGYTLDDFKTVIDKKYHEWGRKPTKEELQRGVNDMRIYLRPKTLFGSNFDVYLNQEQTEKMPAKPPVSRNLNNFERRGYDMDSLEEQLLNSN
ncbi:conserved phage C-terminal domain-containing protein [Mediterraneibacter gnavus]|uniref:conserved phage C-terminal domain-containing protein n=1 Tax=Mediterraneibacter gnavus TaxID=33038 RepID=UPI003A139DD0